MPFDPSFTPDEFEAAFTADPKILERIAPVLAKKEFVVRDKATNDTYETNLKNAHRDTVLKDYTAAEEADILESTGVKRGADETAAAYRARVLKAQKTEFDKDRAELATLRKSSNVSDTERARIKELETSLETLNGNFAEKEKTYQQQITSAKMEGTIASELSTIRQGYLKTLPATAVKYAEEAVVAQISKEAKIEEGKVVYVNADGSIQRDPATLLPLTTAEKLLAGLKDLMDPGHKAKGAASGNREDTDKTGLPPEGVKTQKQLYDYIKEQKFEEGTPKFIAEFNRLGGKGLPPR